MKIRALDLRAFGHFTGQRIDFSQAHLTLVYGPNGGGKSTALTAIESALFGVDETTTFTFLHRPDQLRIGLELEDALGNPISLLRRKGRKNTLSHLDGSAWTDHDGDSLRGMLHGMDRGVFVSMFGLSHRTLRAGAEELLRSEGELGQSLLGAETGMPLGHLSQVFAKGAEEIWAPRGQLRPLNVALRSYKEAHQSVAKASIKPRQWLDAAAAEKALAARQSEQETERQKSQNTLRELERLKGALPVLAEIDTAEWALQSLAPAPMFSHAQLELSQSARATEARADHDLDSSRGVLTDKIHERDRLEVDEAMVARAGEVRAGEQGIAGYGQSRRDLPKRKRERDTLEGDALARLKQYWPGWTLESVQSELSLGPHERVACQRLADAPALRDAESRTIVDAQRRLDRRTATWRATLAKLGPRQDSTALTVALEASQRDGPLERDLEAAQRSHARVQYAVNHAIERLHLADHELAAVAALTPPTRETVDAFRVEWQEMERVSEAVHVDRQDWVDKQAATQRELRALELARPVPSVDALEKARASRDGAFLSLQRRSRAGDRIGAEVWNSYQEAVETADKLSDQLWHEAERVAQRARLAADEELQIAGLAALTAKESERELQRTDWDSRWTITWQPCGIDPPPVTEAVAWIEAHATVADRFPELFEAQALVSDLKTRRDRSILALRSALTASGEMVPATSTLAEIQERASQVRRNREKAEQQQQAADAGLSSQSEEQQALDERRELLDSSTVAWGVEWTTALERLHLPADTTADSVRSAIQELEGALQDARSVSELDDRIAGIQRDMQEFATTVAGLVTPLAPDLRSLTAPDEQARQLGERLRATEAARTRRADLERDIEGQESTIEALETTRLDAQGKLAGLAKAVGLDDRAELELAVTVATERDRLSTELNRLKQDLLGRGTGWTVEDFQTRRAAVEPDALEQSLRDLEEAMAAQEHDLRDTVKDHALAAKLLEDISGGGATAALAAEDQQAAAAEVALLARRYAVIQCAAALLRITMDRYREQHQGEVLARAGEFFRTLTDGEFERLDVTESSADDAAIAAIRAEKGRPSPVAELSDGECDQLYLALRLASIERHCVDIGPMPLILDDVLVYFDDERSTAALRLLAELSQRTQVLVFTHHRHLIGLAEAALGTDVIATERISGPERSRTDPGDSDEAAETTPSGTELAGRLD